MIPPRLRDRLAADPFMRRCIHANRPTGVECDGRITFEHALTYKGRQVNEAWAIVPVCEYHHLGPGLDKNLNRHVALQRAGDQDIRKYRRAGWEIMKSWLTKRYGDSYPPPSCKNLRGCRPS